MASFTTGPVARGVDTDRVQVLATNNSFRFGTVVRVVVRDLGRRCPRRLYTRRRWLHPGRTVSFDIDLCYAYRYEVRLFAASHHVFYYITGYRPGRWWPRHIHDPSTSFRHTELIRLH